MVENDAVKRQLEPIDATCPLVSKVHREGQKYAKRGYEIILIGHDNHSEVERTLGHISGTVHFIGNLEDVASLEVRKLDPIAYITQTN